jgi:hypothetical protein
MMSTGVRRGIVTTIVALEVLVPITAFGRIWRDTKGNAINADFVRIDRDIVYLKPANKYAPASPFSYYDLSPEDQAYVNLVLEKRGEKNKIPPPREKPDGQPRAPVGSGAVPVTIVPGSRPPVTGPTIPGSNVTNLTGTIPDIAPNTVSPSIPITVTPTAPPTFNPTPSVTLGPSPSVTPNSQPTAPASPMINPPSTTSSPAPHPRLYVGPDGRPTIFQCANSKQCMQCGQAVSGASKVGGRCPHCNTFWVVELDEQGRVVQSSSSWFSGGSSSYDRYVFRAAAIIGAMIMGGIIKLVRSK